MNEREVIIKHGVFKQTKTIIPYSRIQNISIMSGILDRKFDLNKITIETAGYGSKKKSEFESTEGIIYGQKNPSLIENILIKQLEKLLK